MNNHLEPDILPFQWIQSAHQKAPSYIVIITVSSYLPILRDVSPASIYPSPGENVNNCTAGALQKHQYIL